LTEFLRHSPCLEELEGFRDQSRKDDRWTKADQVAYLMRRDLLERGKEIPTPTKLDRAWEYKRGKAPKKKKRAVSD
jgi:hypothetical protein